MRLVVLASSYPTMCSGGYQMSWNGTLLEPDWGGGGGVFNNFMPATKSIHM